MAAHFDFCFLFVLYCCTVRSWARFRARKTGSNPPVLFLLILQGGSSVAHLLYLCACDFICGVCVVLICSLSLLPLAPRDGCGSWLWHFLGIFTYICDFVWFLVLWCFTDDIITKICLYDFDPLKPHFYTVKLGFTGVYIIFLISAQKHRLRVLVRTASSRRF